MATLAKSAVSLYGTNAAAQVNNQFHSRAEALVWRRLKLVLTGQGGQTNTITARVLGFAVIVNCSTLFDDTNNKGYPAAVDPVTNTIVLFDGSAAPAPVDVTSSEAYISVLGVLDISAALT
jgi:hypothetical protein